jgi:DNA-binding CsgD family transcriptional regulator
LNKSVKNGQLKKTPSYGRIKISIIGGIFMSRQYRHIEEYSEEILRLKAEGKTRAEIGKQLGFSKEQIHNFISKYNEKQRQIAAGIAMKKKGRPAKDSVVTEENKVADLRYKLARKDARIRQLEMENELIRDFLSLTERK